MVTELKLEIIQAVSKYIFLSSLSGIFRAWKAVMIISGRMVGADNNFHFTPIMACYSVLARAKEHSSKDHKSKLFDP